MKIHKRQDSKNVTFYFFTKTKNKSLIIKHDKSDDYGEHSRLGVHINNLTLHYQNGWITDDLPEIGISEVPKSIKDILTFLNIKD